MNQTTGDVSDSNLNRMSAMLFKEVYGVNSLDRIMEYEQSVINKISEDSMSERFTLEYINTYDGQMELKEKVFNFKQNAKPNDKMPPELMYRLEYALIEHAKQYYMSRK